MYFPQIADVLAACAERRVRSFSFDVFDTFLIRRCATPEGVFERTFDFSGISRDDTVWRRNFHTHRKHAEAGVRAAQRSDGKGSEVRIEEIYDRFPVTAFGLAARDRPALVEAELAAECDLCFVNDEALALYRALQEKGIKVGFISDIYWSRDHLARLLLKCVPDLKWDFLYASSTHRVGKASGLFDLYLKKQKVQPQRAAHIGDNPSADIRPAQKLGMLAFHCPQMSPALAGVLQREHYALKELCHANDGAQYLDHGLTTLRRRIVASLMRDETLVEEMSSARLLGASVIGPVMTLFDKFIRDRVAEVEALPDEDGSPRKVGVVFLARDGLLPLQVWQAMKHDGESYASVNRRVALVGGSHDRNPLLHLFKHVPGVTLEVVEGILKTSIPSITKFFERQTSSVVSGKSFAKALPKLLTDKQIRSLSEGTRKRLMVYLRKEIANFDDLTDIVLVDVGYSGTAQKALRQMLDAEGVSTRLHGVYVIAAQEGFYNMDADDTVVGLLSDHVLPPHVNLALRFNVAVLEQIFSEPKGSVNDYDEDGGVRREDDPRSPEQLALCEDVRRGVLDFVRGYQDLQTRHWPDPLGAVEPANADVAAILTRFLLLPTDNEISLLKDVKLDVNLGSQAQIPLVDPEESGGLLRVMNKTTMFSNVLVNLWPAASVAGVAPVEGYLYSQFAKNALPGDVFADAPCGDIEVIVVRDNRPSTLSVRCFRTDRGMIRLRLPVPGSAGTVGFLLPMNVLPPQGMIRGLHLQGGETMQEANSDVEPKAIPYSALVAEGVDLMEGGLYAVRGTPAHILIQVPPTSKKANILTVLIDPAGDTRLLALTDEVWQS